MFYAGLNSIIIFQKIFIGKYYLILFTVNCWRHFILLGIESQISAFASGLNFESDVSGMDNSAAEDTGGTRLKRRRKPSDKLLESQVEKANKKSSQRNKLSGK